MKLKNIILSGAVCSAFFFGTSAQAANEKVSLSLSFDYNSHFMSSGANVWGGATEDIGDEFLFQPSVGVEFALSDTSAIYAGVWFDINSIIESDIGGDFQEIDVWVGYYFGLGDFTIDLTLQQWYYASETEGIFDITVSYDTLFSPYLRARNRIEGVGDQNTGTMFELGGTLYEYTCENTELTLSIPVGIAANFDEYHVDDEDGYAYSFIGVNFSYPLPISDEYGVWDIHGGLTYYHTDDDNIDNRDSDGDDQNNFLTASFGIGVSF